MTDTVLPAPHEPVIDTQTGLMRKPWYDYFNQGNITLNDSTSVMPTSRGGTGQSTPSEAVGELIQATTTLNPPDRIADTVGVYDASLDTGAQTPMYAVSGMVVLASGALSSQATLSLALDDTGYSNFHSFKLIMSNVQPASDAVKPFIRFSDDGGATFEADAADYAWTCYDSDTGAGSGDVSDSEIELFGTSDVGNAANEGIDLQLTIYNPGSTGDTRVTWEAVWNRAADGGMFWGVGGGAMLVAGVSTDVRFLFSAGNINSGRYTLVGIE